MEPGTTASFQAIATLSDGSTRDVTLETNWTILPASAQAVLTISSAGVASAHRSGVASIAAACRCGGTGTAKQVKVIPENTFVLWGSVVEGGAGIPDATVEVTSGAFAGLSATTTWEGAYWLYGVAGDVEVRASRDGYQPQLQRVTVTQDRMLAYTLTLSSRRAQIAGAYSLTLTASDKCATSLPGEARVRTYSAAVVQDGSRLDVMLSGALFLASAYGGDKFSGRVGPEEISFLIDPYNEGDGINEQLTPASVLKIAGGVFASPSVAGFTGTMSGTIALMTTGALSRSCHAADHRFALSR